MQRVSDDRSPDDDAIRAAEIRGATWALEAVSGFLAGSQRRHDDTWPLDPKCIVDKRSKVPSAPGKAMEG